MDFANDFQILLNKANFEFMCLYLGFTLVPRKSNNYYDSVARGWKFLKTVLLKGETVDAAVKNYSNEKVLDNERKWHCDVVLIIMSDSLNTHLGQQWAKTKIIRTIKLLMVSPANNWSGNEHKFNEQMK